MKQSIIKTYLVLTLLLAANHLLLAQTDTLRVASMKQKSAVMAEKMRRELGLSPIQVQKLETVFAERFSTIDQLRADHRFVNHNSINQSTRRKISEILTRQQLKEFEQLQSNTGKQKDEFYRKHPHIVKTTDDLDLEF